MGGHHAAAGWRPTSGTAPSVAMKSTACIASDTLAKARAGRIWSSSPWQASSVKNTQTQPPAVGVKFARAGARPEVTNPNRKAATVVNAREDTPNAISRPQAYRVQI